MASNRVDDKYYQVARPSSLAERLVIKARTKIYKDFMRICRPRREDTILDVGVSDVIGDAPNLLERMYPYREQITAVGLGSAEAFQAEFPEVRYRKVTPNTRLPFADRSFAIATSNAVLEHVGSVENQRRLVSDMMRVAQRIFITVPNRHFPIEHHTGIPLLHYLDATFGPACRLLGKADWGQQANLILMSRHRLRNLWPEGVSVRIGMTGLPLGPFSSNLFAYWHGEEGPLPAFQRTT